MTWAAKAWASLLRGGRTRCAEPTTVPSNRATNSSRSGTSSTPRKLAFQRTAARRLDPAETAAVDDCGVRRFAQGVQVLFGELGEPLNEELGFDFRRWHDGPGHWNQGVQQRKLARMRRPTS